MARNADHLKEWRFKEGNKAGKGRKTLYPARITQPRLTIEQKNKLDNKCQEMQMNSTELIRWMIDNLL